MHFCKLCNKLSMSKRETIFEEFELENWLCDTDYIEFLEFVIKDNNLNVSKSSYEKYKNRLEIKVKPKKASQSATRRSRMRR